MFTFMSLLQILIGFHTQECIQITLYLIILYRIYDILFVLKMKYHILTYYVILVYFLLELSAHLTFCF